MPAMPTHQAYSSSSSTPSLGVSNSSLETPPRRLCWSFPWSYIFGGVDAYSKWLEIFPVSTATSATTIDKLRSVFTTHGLPKVFVTDNGTQFTSGEFQAFMKNNGIKHICSSPYHLSTNGLAERSVQSFKEHMKCMPEGSIEERLSQFFFWYRVPPHSTRKG